MAVEDVRGTVGERTKSGPVHVEGGAGQFDIETQNGPLTVALSGSRWDGRLDARANDGPLNVRVPSTYTAGVEISSSGRSPWSCQAAACRSGNRDWDDRSRSLRIGSDPVIVRISTNNGPVTINEREP